jgi:hypothetical protein
MKRKLLTLFIILPGLILTACGPEGFYQATLITKGSHTLAPKTAGDVFVFGGMITLERDAILNGSVHMFSGKLQLEGEINGDVSLLGGELNLGSLSQINGDLNHGGGDLSGFNRAAIAGQYNTGTGIQIPSVPEDGRQSLAEHIGRWLINAVIMGLFALVLMRYLPKQMNHVIEASLSHTVICTAMGALVSVVGVSLLVLLAYTILLIPVALLGLGLLGISIVYGWASYGIALGRFAARYFDNQVHTGWLTFVSVFIFMLFLNLLTAIPIIGGILGILISIGGLGAVFLTRFGMRRFIPESAEIMVD